MPPTVTVLKLRRYRCQRCRAVLLSCPRGVLPRLRYTAVAVALALVLWGVEGDPGHAVRHVVAPLPSSGDERFHGWRSLSRWARGAARWWSRLRGSPSPSARSAAVDVVRQLAAHALIPTGSLRVDACDGASRA
jgi:hypothetical protein